MMGHKNIYDQFPDRVKELFWEEFDEFMYYAVSCCCDEYDNLKRLRPAIYAIYKTGKQKSPIETIFLYAFYYTMERLGLRAIDIFAQQEINTSSGKRYILDFLVKPVRPQELKTIKILPVDGFLLAIECDGKKFHNQTNEQRIYDRERDYNLQKDGITTLRFSGKRIYNDPYGCAEEAIEMMVEHGFRTEML